jgi:hypothetical protein
VSSRFSAAVKARIRAAAGDLCGYCLSPQALIWDELEIEHIIPVGRGGTDDESNLWLACAGCNSFKQARTEAVDSDTQQLAPLFNPRMQRWHEHFRWLERGARIDGITATGRATVSALRLNDSRRVQLRKIWISIGWNPPGAK